MPEIEALGLLRRAGITLRVEGDSLVASPGSALTDELKALIRDHKAELILIHGVVDSASPKRALALPVGESTLGYTQQELVEMDKLLVQLAEMEDWPDDELAGALLQRRRMAPVRVPEALRAIREAHRGAMAVWPNAPSKRSVINLCEVAP